MGRSSHRIPQRAESVAVARDRGVLKRLRGTPLRPLPYLAGWLVAALWMVGLTAALILALGWTAFDAHVTGSGLAIAVGVLLLGNRRAGRMRLHPRRRAARQQSHRRRRTRDPHPLGDDLRRLRHR